MRNKSYFTFHIIMQASHAEILNSGVSVEIRDPSEKHFRDETVWLTTHVLIHPDEQPRLKSWVFLPPLLFRVIYSMILSRPVQTTNKKNTINCNIHNK